MMEICEPVMEPVVESPPPPVEAVPPVAEEDTLMVDMVRRGTGLWHLGYARASLQLNDNEVLAYAHR